MHLLYKIDSKFYFLFFLVLVSGIYGYFNILDSRPQGMHVWRQTDCLSFAANYYYQDLPFLEPEIYWQGSDKGGKTVSEFPIIYYLTAKIWKITGKHEHRFSCIIRSPKLSS